MMQSITKDYRVVAQSHLSQHGLHSSTELTPSLRALRVRRGSSSASPGSGAAPGLGFRRRLRRSTGCLPGRPDRRRRGERSQRERSHRHTKTDHGSHKSERSEMHEVRTPRAGSQGAAGGTGGPRGQALLGADVEGAPEYVPRRAATPHAPCGRCRWTPSAFGLQCRYLSVSPIVIAVAM